MKNFIYTLIFLSFNIMAESYVVEMKHPLKTNEKEQISNINGFISIKQFTDYKNDYFNRLYVIETTKNILANIKKLKFVSLVEKNFNAEFFEIKPNPNSKMLSNDYLFPLQWGILNQEQIASKKTLSGVVEETKGIKGYDIDWEKSIKNIESKLKKSPVVAIVDMGIDLDHPELKDQILRNDIECDSSGKATGGSKLDKDKNNYPGDCHGWNFAATDELYWQYPIDDKNHGTHIAGIIAGKKNNDLGITGVSDQIKILPIKVTGAVDESDDKNHLLIKAPSQRIANGILYAIRRGVDVINLSLGWPKSMDTNFMRNTIAEAISKNIIVVAAAGNNNTNANIYPCSYFDVICVGSIDIDGNLSAFSNYGGAVDILAPGDQIVSTIPTSFIPLKLNVQGYDILSGTSQSAPYVSATAALLKGVFPKSSNEEIMRRIFDSAMDKKQNSKSLHGNLQLGKAFNLEKKSSVKPIFKNFSSVIFDEKDGSFKFVLNLKNFGAPARDIKVNISSTQKGLLFKKSNYTISSLNDYTPTSITIEGSIIDQMMDLKAPLSVSIKAHDLTEKIYFHELFFSKNLLSIKDAIDIGFKYDERIPVAFLKDGEVIDNLRTIDEVFPKGDIPSYFVKYQNQQKNDGIKIHFFHYENGFFNQEQNFYENKDAIQLLSIAKGDYNYDGTEDLLIKTIVRKQNDSYILYSYRNLDLSNLSGSYSDIPYYPRYVNVDTTRLRYNKTKLPDGSFLATPIFIEQGALPKENQTKDPWQKPDRSISKRIYHLEIVKQDNHFVYKLKSIYNQDFVNNLKNKFKDFLHSSISTEDAELTLLGFTALNSNDYINNRLKIYFSFGLGVYRENFIVDLNQLENKNMSLAVKSTSLLASDLMELKSLGSNIQTNQDVFVRYLSEDKLSLTIMDDNYTKYIYQLDDPNDIVQSFVSLYRDQTNDYAILETVDHLVMTSFDRKSKKVNTSKVKTTKFSFLPGLLMSELYYPIKILSEDKNLIPAIYVDSTKISGNYIYTNTVFENKLIRPAHLSVHVPSFCTAKNPVQSSSGGYRYTFLCASQKGFYLKYVDLNI